MSMTLPTQRVAPPMPEDEFFIGWLAPPPGYARRLCSAAIASLLLAATAASGWTWLQQSPGRGQWDTTPHQFRGVVEVDPYALLHFTGDNGEWRTALLVSSGKFGAAERLRPWHGRGVEVTGTLLHRDGRVMVELADGEDAVTAKSVSPTSSAANAVLPRQQLGPATLVGEVIDPKCYLGAMKPGGGHTHRGCAVLCIRGGIPPMLAIRDAAGRETFVLLTLADGAAAGEALLPFVGDRIRAAGRLEQRGDLTTLRVDLASLVRTE